MGAQVKTDDRGTSSARFTFIGKNDGLNFNVITDKENTIAEESSKGAESLRNFTDIFGICRTMSVTRLVKALYYFRAPLHSTLSLIYSIKYHIETSAQK